MEAARESGVSGLGREGGASGEGVSGIGESVEGATGEGATGKAGGRGGKLAEKLIHLHA